MKILLRAYVIHLAVRCILKFFLQCNLYWQLNIPSYGKTVTYFTHFLPISYWICRSFLNFHLYYNQCCNEHPCTKSLSKTVTISVQYLVRNGIVTSKIWAFYEFGCTFPNCFPGKYANSDSCQQELRVFFVSPLSQNWILSFYYFYNMVHMHVLVLAWTYDKIWSKITFSSSS